MFSKVTLYCKYAVHKFLKQNRCFVLQLESHVRDGFIRPSQLRILRLYCILFTQVISYHKLFVLHSGLNEVYVVIFKHVGS